jgi:type II secretory pathway pseudopilin PulG
VIVVIAVIGIGVMIAIPMYSNSMGGSREAIARNTLETLNTAVHKFNMSNYELLFTGVAPSGQDEMLILRTMQYRDPVRPKPGAPYMRNDWNPDISTSSDDYRLMWSGTIYKLLKPGEPGAGLKVVFDASDLGTPFEFPPNFTMAGK